MAQAPDSGPRDVPGRADAARRMARNAGTGAERAPGEGAISEGRGVILNITSVHEVVPGWGGAAYDAAKAGLRNITRNLSRELAKQGIRVNNIAPGFIATPMTEKALNDPEEMEESRKNIPPARPGRPDEVGAVVLFPASDDSSYVTGSSYFVDGGLLQRVGAGA